MQTTRSTYRDVLIIKHVTHDSNGTFFTVVLGGIVWKHWTHPEAMAAIDKWLDSDD